jgi:hypothetical protein
VFDQQLTRPDEEEEVVEHTATFEPSAEFHQNTQSYTPEEENSS